MVSQHPFRSIATVFPLSKVHATQKKGVHFLVATSTRLMKLVCRLGTVTTLER
jgi:hypothetical protein